MFAMTLRQWRKFVTRFHPAAPKRLSAATGREERSFKFAIDGKLHKARGFTKSEARARLKKKLGLERLPPHCSAA